MLSRYRWILIAIAAMATASAGLYWGKTKEKEYLSQMYGRRDFTLLDDRGSFFELSKFPADKLLLLIFTPDAISPSIVPSFREFSRHIGELKKLDVEVMMITRTNREIVMNFKAASRFAPGLLVDTSGTVGRNIGIWPDPNPVAYWGYALIDNHMQVYWAAKEPAPFTFDVLMDHLKKLSASMKTSSGSP